jgi:hypothetical protein
MSEQYFFLHPEGEQEFEELILVTLVLVKLFRSPVELAICSEIVNLTLIERWTGPGLLLEVAERLQIHYGAVRKKLCSLRPALRKLLSDYYSIENTDGGDRINDRPKTKMEGSHGSMLSHRRRNQTG